MKQPIALIFALMILVHQGIFATPFGWADTIGGSGTSRANTIAADKNNNLYVCGQMDGFFKPGNVNFTGKSNFLIKYNSQGIILWAKPLPGLFCKCLAIDPLGNPCIAGSFSDTVHIGKVAMASAGMSDFFLAKFDSVGNLIWANHGGGTGNDVALGIACDVEGNTNITGSFEDYADFDPNNSVLSLGKGDMFVAQYDTAGKFAWAGNGGGNGADAGTAIGVDLTGDVFVTGYFNGSATFHNNSIQSTGGNNMFIVKYTPLGYQLYVHPIGCNGAVMPNAIGLDGSGDVYIAGKFNGTAVFGNKTITSSGDDGFVAAYDNSLNLNWLNQIGGSGNDAALGIVSDWESNIFVTGVFTSSAGFGGSILTGEGGTDIFLAKYDAAGRLLWTERAGGKEADSSFSVCVDGNDIASITGTVISSADFGDINLKADTGGSFFIAQMKQSPTGIDMPVGCLATFQVYPNPSTGIFNINGLSDDLVSMKVMDAAGRAMNIPKPFPNQLNLQDCPDGIYFLTIETRNGRQTEKLVKTDKN